MRRRASYLMTRETAGGETDTGQMSQIGRVLIPVADQDKAIAFYTQVLGFTLTADMPYGNGDRWQDCF